MSHLVEDAIASHVADVMTTKVVVVRPDTPYKVIAAKLCEHRIDAVPVVTDHHHVLGVVSTADLLAKAALAGEMAPSSMFGSRQHREQQQARALTAADLMTSPAITVGPQVSVRQAAQRMASRHVKRLPVVDADGHLLGIISRGDVLAVFRRSDEDIQRTIVRDVIADAFFTDPALFDVTVNDGVVTLAGPSDLELIRHGIALQVRHLEGVVAVRERTQM